MKSKIMKIKSLAEHWIINILTVNRICDNKVYVPVYEY